MMRALLCLAWWGLMIGCEMVFLTGTTARVLAQTAPPAGAAAVGEGDIFLRDFAETRGFLLGRPVDPLPTPDGKAVLFLRARGPREPSQELYEFDVASRQNRRPLSPDDALQGSTEQLSPEEKARRERQRISVGGFTAFSISKDSAHVLLSLSGKLYVLDRTSGKVQELPTAPGGAVDPKFSPDGRSVAYVSGFDVRVCDLAAPANGQAQDRAITTGGTEEHAHGLAEFVAQEEMARFSGYWLSPDGKHLLYQENDATGVESWFVSDPALPENEPARSFYPRPGKPNVAVSLYLTTVDGTGKPAAVEWDRIKYPYLGKVTWTEDGPLTLTVLSRTQTDLSLLKVDPATGRTATLLTEHDPTWINLEQDVPHWLSFKDGGGFLWSSEREGDGWQLECRRADGSLAAVLVPASAGYGGLVGVAGGRVLYHSVPSPTETLVSGVSLSSSGGMNLPPKEDGVHKAVLGENEAVYVDQVQTRATLPRAMVRSLASGEAIGELPSIALEPPFLPRAEWTRIGRTSPDNKDAFECVVVRPRDFDPAKRLRYPVIVDVYGGPGHQQVLASARPYLLDQWLADQGFVVVAADGRGTPGRGRAWERAIAGHFGSVPLDDQVAALRALGAKYPEMDLERVGITGWSFGGYMSALAVLRRPDVFKAAVAGAPVVDWFDYDTTYTERYLGVPDDKGGGDARYPDAYREGSLLTYADELTRPLLLIHGTSDDNVFFRHTLRLSNALFRAGKPFELLPLSSLTHMVPDPVVRQRLEERIIDHFHRHLGAPE